MTITLPLLKVVKNNYHEQDNKTHKIV